MTAALLFGVYVKNSDFLETPIHARPQGTLGGAAGGSQIWAPRKPKQREIQTACLCTPLASKVSPMVP